MRLLPLLALLSACTAAAPDLPAPTGGELTVFVHGYKGSFLRSADGERPWITPGAALSGGERSLALPFPGQAPQVAFGPLEPDGPITHLTLLPLLASQEVYLRWMEYARAALPGFIAFSYDWRQDVRDSGERLCGLLDGYALRLGPSLRVNLVVHSMGGLVSLQCLRTLGPGARAVRRIVFAGTPFRGAADIFPDLMVGNPIGRNRALLSREALFTFASAFQLLPRESDFFRDAADAHVPLEPLSPTTWLEHGWGVFAEPARRSDPAYRAQLDKMLAAHAAIAQDQRPLPPALEAMAIVGLGHPTPSGVRVPGGDAPVDGGDSFDFEHPPRADGDGLVTSESARPDFPCQIVEVSSGHAALLDDDAAREAIQRFLARPLDAGPILGISPRP